MNNRMANKDRKDYEIPCTLLPATEFDMAESVPPEKRATVPVGGFVQDAVLHETSEIELRRPTRWPRSKLACHPWKQ